MVGNACEQLWRLFYKTMLAVKARLKSDYIYVFKQLKNRERPAGHKVGISGQFQITECFISTTLFKFW